MPKSFGVLTFMHAPNFRVVENISTLPIDIDMLRKTVISSKGF